MTAQTDWVGEASEAPSRRSKISTAHNPQSRILVFRMLDEAGPDGVASDALVSAMMTETGIGDDGARARLGKDKKAGLIFGKGAYLSKQGITYRYFRKPEWADAYVFDVRGAGLTHAEKVRQRDRERWAAARAAETAEEAEQRREKDRQRRWAKKGCAEPPPQPERKVLKGLSADERKALERERGAARRERIRQERVAAGLPAYGRPANGTGRRRSTPEARPGLELVVVLPGTEAPVRVTKRPVLVGEPIITSETRVTIAPVGRDYRYWVDPGTVRPVFGALGVGRLLEGELV